MERLLEIADDFETKGFSLPRCVFEYINNREQELKQKGISFVRPKYATTSQYISYLDSL